MSMYSSARGGTNIKVREGDAKERKKIKKFVSCEREDDAEGKEKK
jgi:hypothetical protein